MPGVVIRLSPRGFGDTTANGDIVNAGAAALDKRVAETAAAANLSGLEFFFGIPGTIGGGRSHESRANGAPTPGVLFQTFCTRPPPQKHNFSQTDHKIP